MKKKTENMKSKNTLTKLKFKTTQHVLIGKDGEEIEIIRKRIINDDKKLTLKAKNGQVRDYFNIRHFLTSAKLALFSIFFFVTERNLGKGYSANSYILEDWETNGKGFVWMRRNKNEIDMYIKSMRNSWYNEGYVVKDYVMYDLTKGAGGNIVGYFIALKTSYEFASSNFDNINKIVFDEFISRSGYLKDEYTTFTDFLKTIERDDDLLVIFNGNSLTQNNPYFVKFDIWSNDRQVEDKERRMLIYQPVKGDYIVPIDEESSSTIFAKQDEKIYNYMFFNEYSFDDTSLIKKLDGVAIDWIYNIMLLDKHYKYGIGKNGEFYFDEGVANGKPVYSLLTKDQVEKGNINVPYDIKNFVAGWKNSLVNKKLMFGSFEAKDDIIEFLVRIEGSIAK